MLARWLTICGCLLWLSPRLAEGQTLQKLSSVIPGTERTQLVYNGDFQSQGPLVNGAYPSPAGWARVADMFAGAGIHAVPADESVAGLAQVDGGAPACMYSRAVNLLPNTDYVLSAYLWNMGDAANHVTTAVDFNDAPQEPQLTLYCSHANASAQQCFRLGPEVDASTMTHKLLMGYQGWFGCPNDGSQPNRWIHWFRNNTPAAPNATVDFWPDISELDPDELFATNMTLTNGSPARVYSAFTQKTVVRHFKWMKDNHLDGVFLQRFTSELSDPAFFALRNQVATNVRRGADTYGRVFAIMYDISGQPAATLVNTLTNDWAYLSSFMQITNSPRYLRHKGKPVVAVWGFGFTDRPGTPQDAQTVAAFFKAAGCTVVGGVPTYWRTLNIDSQTNAAWAAAYLAFDVISPWAVGRYGTTTGADNFKAKRIVPDLAYTAAHNVEYMPVIFPGFSWHNLNAGPLNRIPRNSGAFYWRQAYNAISAGCTMIYGAMFDEMDEGTAMLKLAPTANELPVQGTFVPLNIDGQALPSDWYLRLADQASRMLRGDSPLQTSMPIAP